MKDILFVNLEAAIGRKIFKIIFIVSTYILTGIFTIHAQDEIKNPERGFNPGATYQFSEIEQTNTTNGNLMLSIPIVKLPKGRGEVGQGINLVYNSKLYDTVVEEVPDETEEFSDQFFLSESETGGWKYATNDYVMIIKSRFDTAPLVGGCEYQANRWKVQMSMPDGSLKEFRPTGFNDPRNDGYFRISPNGYWMNCPDPNTPSSTLITTDPMVYYSTDGSYIKLVIDHVNNGDVRGQSNPWTMYLPDGGRVTGGVGVATRIYDRNNNYIEGLTDSVGRSISVQLNAATDEDHITAYGTNNEELVWKVKWKTISVSKSYQTSEASSGGGRGGSSTQSLSMQFRVVDRITLPTQFGSLYYEFNYNSESNPSAGWGELSHVKLPSGAETDYEYTTPIPVNTSNVLLNYVSEKTLTYLAEYDGATTPVTETWEYNIGKTQSTITAPNGNVTTEYHGNTSYQNLMSGLVYKTVNSDGSRAERIWAFNRPTGANSSVNINAYIKTEFTTISDASGNPLLTAIKDYTIDPNGNQTEVKEYDWVAYSSVPKDSQGNVTGIPSEATLKRTTNTSYYNSVSANSANAYWLGSSPNVRNAVSRTEIAGVSATEITYDNAATTANPTTVKIWDSTKNSITTPLTTGNSISTSTTYDSYGNPLTTTDANGVQTTITYGCIDGQTSCSASLQNLYPTKIEAASNYSGLKKTSTIKYDFYTGLPTLETDVDNDVSTATTYDDLGRPTKMASAVGEPEEIWTQTVYDDINRMVIVKSDIETKGDGKKIAVQHYDQLGRVRLSRSIENPDTEDPTDEADGIKVQTRYLTTSGYSYQLSSNPYRATTSSGASSEPSMGWTRSKTVNTGKHSEVETFSGATLPQPFLTSGYNTNSTGKVQTDIDANRTLVTDQAGKQRISKSNALGQLTDIWEIMAASDASTVSVTFPNQSLAYGYQTSYSYDTLNNLATVSQGSQTRSFSYSSLSRLLSAVNPESGTISYEYDNNGNLSSKTDARSITTDYTYDALNRVTNRDYSDSTPDVTYTYDSLTNAKGKLTKVTTGNVSTPFSVTEYTEFDILGRVKKSKQTTDGTAYPEMEYTYNLSGALVEQKYPSGRVVKNILDNNGDISMVQSKKNSNYGFWNYAKSFTYTAAGAVQSMQLGNFKWESTVFNSRLQPTQIALGSTQNATNLLDLDYTYGTTNNNGNVLTQTITVPTVGANTGFMATQTYTYDSLNRIKEAKEMISTTETWKQTFDYDRFGNRNFDEANTTTLPKNCGTSPNFTVCTADRKVLNPEILTTNNRLKTDQDSDSINDYLFDTSGNTTKSADGNTYIYDAENKQIEVKNVSNQTIGEYFYDGDGKRVKKVVPNSETTIFVYDASGKMVAEYSTVLATTPQVSYLTNDHLGSPRLNTNENGAVTARHDYQPFGEEITTSQRITNLGYNSDEIRKKFTGYERDAETSLDFAQARFYNPAHGRFITTDPLLGSGSVENAQSWNRYIYVKNNPLYFIDPTGLYECVASAEQCKAISAELTRIQGLRDSLDKKSKNYKKLDRVLKTYGCDAAAKECGDKGKNGLKVAVGNTGSNRAAWSGTSGEQATKTDANPTGRIALVVFSNDFFIDGMSPSDLTTVVAHEGSHLADGEDWVRSGFLDSKNPTFYKAEFDAYTVSGIVEQLKGFAKGAGYARRDGQGNPTGRVYYAWNKAWKNVDASRAVGVQNIIRVTTGQTPKNQGGKTLDKKLTQFDTY